MIHKWKLAASLLGEVFTFYLNGVVLESICPPLLSAVNEEMVGTVVTTRDPGGQAKNHRDAIFFF